MDLPVPLSHHYHNHRISYRTIPQAGVGPLPPLNEWANFRHENQAIPGVRRNQKLNSGIRNMAGNKTRFIEGGERLASLYIDALKELFSLMRKDTILRPLVVGCSVSVLGP